MRLIGSILNYHGWRVPVYGIIAGLVLATFNQLAGISIVFAFAALGIIGGGFWLLGHSLELLASGLTFILTHEAGKKLSTR